MMRINKKNLLAFDSMLSILFSGLKTLFYILFAFCSPQMFVFGPSFSLRAIHFFNSSKASVATDLESVEVAPFSKPNKESIAKAGQRFDQLVTDKLHFFDNLFNTNLNESGVKDNNTAEEKKTSLEALLSLYPAFLQDELNRLIDEGASLAAIKNHYHYRIRQTEELGFQVHLVATQYFYEKKLFSKEKPLEFDDFVMDAVADGIPSAIVEEVYNAARYRLLHRLTSWLLGNANASRSEVEASGLTQLLQEEELQRLIYGIRVPALMVKILDQQYRMFFLIEAGVSASSVNDDRVSHHLRLKNAYLDRLKKLDAEYPGMIDWDRYHEDQQKTAQTAREAYRFWLSQHKAPVKTAQQNIYHAARGLGEGFYYITVGNAVTYGHAFKGLFDGKGFSNGFEKGAEFILESSQTLQRHAGGALLGSLSEMASQSNAEFYYRYALFPLVQTGEMIQGTLELLDEAYIRSVMLLTDVSRNEYEELLQVDPYFKAGRALFYVSEAALALAVVVSTGGATLAAQGLSGSALMTAQAGLTLKPISIALGMGFVFSLGQELFSAGSEDNEWSTTNLLANTGRGAVGTLLFMGGIGKMTQIMAMRGVSQTRTMVMASGVDVVEGSADIPVTIGMAYDSRNALQYIGTSLIALGNLWDTGDSALSIGKSAYMNGRLHLDAVAKAESGVIRETFQDDLPSLNIEQNARVAIAVSLLGRELTLEQAKVLRSLAILDKDTKAELRSAEFSFAEIQEIIKYQSSIQEIKSNPNDD